MNIHSIHSIQSQADQSHQDFGVVLSITQQGYLVQLESGSTQLAEKAFTCTFVPAKGDYISLIKSPNKGLFIAHILQRESSEQATLEVESSFCIRASQDINIQADQIHSSSRRHSVTSQDYDHHSHTLNVQSEQTHFQSKTVDSHIGRIMQRVKDSFKVIERMEQLRANDVIQNIKNAFIQRSKQVDITAKSDVKINGDRIHMG